MSGLCRVFCRTVCRDYVGIASGLCRYCVGAMSGFGLPQCNYTDSPPAAEFAMRLMKEPRGGLFSWCSYFSNYPLFLVPRVAVKRLQSKITQNTKKQTSSRKSRTGLHKTGARTEGGQYIEDSAPSICSDNVFVPKATVGRLGDDHACP